MIRSNSITRIKIIKYSSRTRLNYNCSYFEKCSEIQRYWEYCWIEYFSQYMEDYYSKLLSNQIATLFDSLDYSRDDTTRHSSRKDILSFKRWTSILSWSYWRSIRRIWGILIRLDIWCRVIQYISDTVTKSMWRDRNYKYHYFITNSSTTSPRITTIHQDPDDLKSRNGVPRTDVKSLTTKYSIQYSNESDSKCKRIYSY